MRSVAWPVLSGLWFRLFVLFVPTIALSLGAAGDGVLPGDVVVARAIQRIGFPGVGIVAQFGYLAGTLVVITALGLGLALALLAVGKQAESYLLLGAILSRNLSPVLKRCFDSPRPTEDLVRVTEHARGLGYPSGHVLSAVILFGSVILIAGAITHDRRRQVLIQGLALFAILATSFSRVYSGAHWPSDVVGGYLWGLTILVFLHWSYQSLRARRRRPSQIQPANAP